MPLRGRSGVFSQLRQAGHRHWQPGGLVMLPAPTALLLLERHGVNMKATIEARANVVGMWWADISVALIAGQHLWHSGGGAARALPAGREGRRADPQRAAHQLGAGQRAGCG